MANFFFKSIDKGWDLTVNLFIVTIDSLSLIWGSRVLGQSIFDTDERLGFRVQRMDLFEIFFVLLDKLFRRCIFSKASDWI